MRHDHDERTEFGKGEGMKRELETTLREHRCGLAGRVYLGDGNEDVIVMAGTYRTLVKAMKLLSPKTILVKKKNRRAVLIPADSFEDPRQ